MKELGVKAQEVQQMSRLGSERDQAAAAAGAKVKENAQSHLYILLDPPVKTVPASIACVCPHVLMSHQVWIKSVISY